MSRSQDRGGSTDTEAGSCQGIHTIVVGVHRRVLTGRIQVLPAKATW